jgi:hypothetical protein
MGFVANERVSSNGRARVFQTRDSGSLPLTRSIFDVLDAEDVEAEACKAFLSRLQPYLALHFEERLD